MICVIVNITMLLPAAPAFTTDFATAIAIALATNITNAPNVTISAAIRKANTITISTATNTISSTEFLHRA